MPEFKMMATQRQNVKIFDPPAPVKFKASNGQMCMRIFQGQPRPDSWNTELRD